MRNRLRAFTLVELLVVIGIIALLIGILLPALTKARESGNALKCAANLRSIGQGLAIYVTENKGTFPAAYIYDGMVLANGVQTPPTAVNGYVHWSSFLYKKGGNTSTNEADEKSIYHTASGWDMFRCPSLDGGGLPPTNTFDANLDGGQTPEVNGILDQQAPRMAYTVNEAVMPRNKFVQGFNGAPANGHIYQYVRAGKVRPSAETILASEFRQDSQVVSEFDNTGGSTLVVKSHRPVHGFVGDNGGLEYDLNRVQMSVGGFGGRPPLPAIFPVSTGFTRPYITTRPPVGQNATCRLNWLGRNHGRGKTARTNFLYVDGHVETKVLEETIAPQFQWGSSVFSLQYNADISNVPHAAP